MKKQEKLLRSLEFVDDDLLEQASPEKKKAKKQPNKILRIAIAACLGAFLLAGSLWLFIPFNTDPPDISRYADSEYYEIMQKLNAVTFVKPRFKNNFDKYILNIFRGATAEDAGAGDGSGREYREVTDNQVEGVIEADLIKRSSENIFYLDSGVLKVFSIQGEASQAVGSFEITCEESSNLLGYSHQWAFYLSEDCRTVTVIAPYVDKERALKVDMISLDVTDPTAIIEKGRVTVSGSYNSSRLVNGEILLLTDFRVSSNPDFSKEANYLPQIDDGTGAKSLAAADIIYPEILSSASYTVICKLEEASLELVDSAAFLSYSSKVYVSAEEIFATRSYTEQIEAEELTVNRSMTEIARVAYIGERLEHKGLISIQGTVLDQYSMDVYEGILRVVTTTSEVPQRKSEDGETVMYDVDVGNTTNAALYCISLADWQVIASVVDFAPRGESVQSARFEGDTAYVCTAIKLTDPVFFFDLSDYNNITYKETGTIEGYSTSLVDFGNGYLLGIGVGSSWTSLKIEIYVESGNDVVSVCKYELEGVSYSTEYKSYFIDRERGLVGLGVSFHGKSADDSYNQNVFQLL